MVEYTHYGPENTQSDYSGNGMGQHYTNPMSLIVRRAVALTNDVGATKVLDLACGRGVTSLALASETQADDIVAIDIHQDAVAELTHTASQLDTGNSIQAQVYDAAEPTGYSNILGSAREVVIAKDLYPFLNPVQIDNMFGNVEEALQPGGWFMLTAPSTRSRTYQESTPGPTENEFYRRLSADSQEYIQTTLDCFTFTTIARLALQLEQHGMEMTEATHIGRAAGWIMAVAQKAR